MNSAVDFIQTTAWDDIASFFPANWEERAQALGVMKGARQDKDLGKTMHALMIYLACGLSLKETTARTRLAGQYVSSHVALRDRLIKFGPLFEEMCGELFGAQNDLAPIPGLKLRLVDATDIEEPGPTGSTWRFHYSLTIPDAGCDFTKLTKAKGAGVGESFMHFPVSEGDHLVADRGYSKANGIAYVARRGGYVCVRLHHASLPLSGSDGTPFGLVGKLRALTLPGQAAEWDCAIRDPGAGELIAGRICAIRKNEEQIALAHKKCRRNGSKYNYTPSEETYFVNEFVIVFTTFDRERFPLSAILTIYRWRWQVELAFKRLKSLLQLGHLPTKAEESSRAWLHGKLFAALLIEKISRHLDGSFSPWRCFGGKPGQGELVDNIRLHGALLEAVAAAGPEPGGNQGTLALD